MTNSHKTLVGKFEGKMPLWKT